MTNLDERVFVFVFLLLLVFLVFRRIRKLLVAFLVAELVEKTEKYSNIILLNVKTKSRIERESAPSEGIDS